MTSEEAFDARTMLLLDGQEPMRCEQIAEALEVTEFEARRSLIRLMDRDLVWKQYFKSVAVPGFYYQERQHGGYSPNGGNAA